MYKIIIALFLLFSMLYSKPITLYENLKEIDILKYSDLYIDYSKELTINDIKKNKDLFQINNNSRLSYGYSPDFNVWIRFKLKNGTNKKLQKILEYDNPLTTHIEFYDLEENSKKIKGLYFRQNDIKTVNSTFKIDLKPNSEKTFYIKANSQITTLIIKLKIWDYLTFFEKELKHQMILALFFGAMFILGIYNLFIFFFTRDISYLYYVIYIIGIIVHHLLYVGFATIYLLPEYWIEKILELAPIIVAIPIIALALFTKEFLNIKQYPKNYKFLNFYLILIPISIIFFMLTDDYDKHRNTLTMLLLIYLMGLTLYATIKKNKQAYFILFGWFVFLISGLTMFLSSAGLFNVYEYFPYIVEASFVSEATIFSIALANRINSLQKEKDDANRRLILHQENETKRLSKKVAIRTKDLKETLIEKELLLKELNHRVKNNMQTIVSLIRLQADEIENDKLQDILVTIQNRINAMSHLHELLYKQDNISHINTYEYFEILVEEVKDSYDKDVDIYLDIKTNIKMEQAVYCGLILNELLTNSFKYAFPNFIGTVDIKLTKEQNKITLIVKDNGIGFKQSSSYNSLGLTLVNTLAVNQLKGEISIDTKNGVETKIVWEDNEQ
ncbi:7TM diverse intracellular signaling domain-containing protein [Halarcobacter bivalviorum]|uniref:histidine kinase n=2 Tax=Halarcobacter bivalviorum TaxID=663364 RepID=A0AB33GGW7_9BACT|nr:7TM diverse intracellular signaling domain-containing protein [Halarcobacter bivalviorum]AXH11286.1 7TMR-DISM-7TM/7TMR-DISMED2 domain-containing two-component system sensor histidine kinase [Halarcobacter bivalviorum]